MRFKKLYKNALLSTACAVLVASAVVTQFILMVKVLVSLRKVINTLDQMKLI